MLIMSRYCTQETEDWAPLATQTLVSLCLGPCLPNSIIDSRIMHEGIGWRQGWCKEIRWQRKKKTLVLHTLSGQDKHPSDNQSSD